MKVKVMVHILVLLILECLKNIGANFVIIGHSENRKNGENNKLINLKIKSALKAKLKVIFCIGETWEKKEKKNTINFI